MSERTPPRKPQTFRLDDPGVVVVDAEDESRTFRGTIQITPEADPAQLPVPIETRLPERRGFRWGTVFWGGIAGLVLLGTGLGVTQLIENLFARSESLGILGLASAFAAALGLGVLTARELLALARLATIEKLHARATSVLLSDDRAESRPVSQAAQRVSIVTAVSPRALVDVLFVFVASLRLIRQLARLYGGRPGALGMIRLLRHVIAHLAITGGLAASDSLVQQMLGHGIAAKLSQRLGEGVLNGLLTARLGLAAIEVTRPLPFTALPQPALTDLAKDLLRKREDEE